MKLIIATTSNPFVEGGATFMVDWLEHALVRRGHEVETFRFPFSDAHDEILDQLVALRLIDLSEHGERLITVRTPSHLLRHPCKVTWFIHHYRSAYDLWGTPYQSLPNSHEGEACRQAIVSADNIGLREARRLFCNSIAVRNRLKKYNGLTAEVLYPPLMNPEEFGCGEYGEYLLYFSRLAHHKRQWLALESLRYTKTPVHLVIAGEADATSLQYVEDLKSAIDRYELRKRVSLMPRWVPHEEKLRLFADCLGVLYFPFDEDSYGYPSLEAHAARKAVLTTTDSGGTIELIGHGVNGFVVPPDPEVMAQHMDVLYRNRNAARQMGEQGSSQVLELGITWDHVVGRLLS